MKMLWLVIPAVLLPGLFSFYGAQNQASSARPATISYVSAQRLLTDSVPGKAYVARVQALQQQRATELRTRQQDLQATREQLAKAPDVATRTKLQEQEQVRQTDFESATAKAQAELQTLQRQIQIEFQGKVKVVLDEMMKDKNLQIVLNSDTSLVWSSPGLDLTAQVIEQLNKAAAATPAPTKP